MSFTKPEGTSEDISDCNEFLKLNLWKYFQHDCFESPVQFNAMQAILQRNQDVVISMPTGSGRSLCYQLPGLLQENKVTIVFCPLKLITHQLEQLRKHKIGAESPNSAPGPKGARKKYYRKVVLNDLKRQTPTTRFLYVTPQMASSHTFLSDVESLYQDDKLAFFAVEEAHSISHWGPYREEYMRLGSFRSAYPSIPWIALTEITAKENVDDIVEHLQLYKPIAWIKTPYENIFRKNLYYDVVFQKFNANNFVHLKEYVTKCLGNIDYQKNQKNRKLLQKQKPCGIIYCRTREISEQIASGLTNLGITTKPHHEGLSPDDRRTFKEDWLAGQFPVISTTPTSWKEIYKYTVKFVVHCAVPQSVARYYRESGQAGQDGRSSYCRIYYDKESVQTIDLILKNEIANSSDNQVKAQRDYDDFLKMCNYCETMACRHKLFSDYFKDVSPECTNRCDVCKNPKETEDALDHFQLNSNNFFDAPIQIGIPIRDYDSHEGKQSLTFCENDDNGPKSYQSENESNSFIRKQLNFLSSKFEHLPVKPLPTFSRKQRARMRKKNNTLLEAFLELHHHSSLTTTESSDQTAPERDPPVLDDFHKIQKDQTKTSGITLSTQLSTTQMKINEEPRSGLQIDLQNFDRISLTFNGQSAPSASCELFRMKTKRLRSISPSNSIIKEEITDDLGISGLNGRTELFGLHARYPRTVSPAETIIKEEYDEMNECSKDALGLVIDKKSALGNDSFVHMHRPPRNWSPAETIIKEENYQPVVPNGCVKLFSPLTNSIIKTEPMSFSEPISPRHQQINRSFGPSFTKRTLSLESESIETISTSSSKSTSNVYNNFFQQNPTDTIIKHERASPEIDSTECQYNSLDNASENYFPNCTPLTDHRIGNKRFQKDRKRSESKRRHSSITRSAKEEMSDKREQDYVRRHEPRKRQRKDIISNNNVDHFDYEAALSKSIMSADASESLNFVIKEKSVNKLPTADRNEHVFHGFIKQIETKYQGQQMPSHLLNMLKTEKSLIAELVKTSLMPYYQAGKIQPKDLFSVVARKISHIFYDRYADETIIKTYIVDLFKKITVITSVRDLESNL